MLRAEDGSRLDFFLQIRIDTTIAFKHFCKCFDVLIFWQHVPFGPLEITSLLLPRSRSPYLNFSRRMHILSMASHSAASGSIPLLSPPPAPPLPAVIPAKSCSMGFTVSTNCKHSSSELQAGAAGRRRLLLITERCHSNKRFRKVTRL